MSSTATPQDCTGRLIADALRRIADAVEQLEPAAAAPAEPDPWLTPVQIAERWSCSQAFVRSEMRSKALRHMRAGALLRSRLSWVASYERKRSE